MISEEPLSVHQINGLSDYSNQYVIPFNDNHSKKYGVILYHGDMNSDSICEAENLDHILRSAGFYVQKMDWSSKSGVRRQDFSDLVKEIADDCSLLVVYLFEFGKQKTEDVCQGTDSCPEEIVVQHLLPSSLRQGLPMVSYFLLLAITIL